MRPDHANLCLLQTYIPDLHFFKFLITALNYLNTEGIPSHSEKYTVRGSIAPRNSGVVTSIYIVANGNETSNYVANFAYSIIT